MIPEFPQFKLLSVNDRELVESHTHKYPPYSDFNFTSLWGWDTSNERMISELNGNLVVRFTDYTTTEPFFSFLGSNETEHTSRELIDYAGSVGISPILHLVPEESVVGIRPSVLHVEEDAHNFDYIYSIPELSALRGSKFETKRKTVERFARLYQDVHVEIGDLENANVQNQVISVIRRWEESKKVEHKEYDLVHEETSIKRLFQTADTHELVVTGVFDGLEMIAFSIDEMLPNEFSISHFSKADRAYKGVHDFLNKKVAEHLEKNGVEFWNWEQDLGLESLKRSKTSYRPVHFLKKYTVSLNSNSENSSS